MTSLSSAQLGPPERWVRLVARVLVFLGVPALLVLVGVATGIRLGEHKAAEIPVKTARASSPTDTAESTFAARFAVSYLSYHTGEQEQWQQSIAPYVAGGVDPSNWWNGEGTQSVTEVLPVSSHPLGSGADQVTVAVLLQGGPWVYLGVPVHAQKGAYAVVGEPALVPAPAASTWDPPQNQQAQTDAQLSAQLKDDVAAFFTAYASGNGTQLSYLTSPEAGIRGLDATVTLAGVSSLFVYQGGATHRSALAVVKWQPRGGSGAVWEQSYRLTLVNASGKWLVATVAPAPGGS